jgi:cation diffusion facilitator family transporter
MSAGSQRVVIAALVINLLIAVFKFIAAGFSRSTAMLAEACHSLADTFNQIFLLIGLRRSARPADAAHPFGYGPESYFWAFMVALSIFAVGAFFSIYEGVHKIVAHDSKAFGDVRWAYATLGVSVLLESYSLFVAMKEFRHIRAGRGVRRTLEEARDPTVVTVLFEDLAALFGLIVAFFGVLLSQLTGNLYWDGIASILVGVALASVAWMLARDSKALLIGKGVIDVDESKIRAIVLAHADVLELVHLRTMHLGPSEVMAGIKVRFRGTLSTHTLEDRINEIEKLLRASIPSLRRIYIEPGFDETIGRTLEPPAKESA